MAIIVRLDDEQEQELLRWVGQMTAEEVAGGCEPSGYDLTIGVSAYENMVRAEKSGKILLLGDCEFLVGHQVPGENERL
jgi:hypothetical protein